MQKRPLTLKQFRDKFVKKQTRETYIYYVNVFDSEMQECIDTTLRFYEPHPEFGKPDEIVTEAVESVRDLA